MPQKSVEKISALFACLISIFSILLRILNHRLPILGGKRHTDFQHGQQYRLELKSYWNRLYKREIPVHRLHQTPHDRASVVIAFFYLLLRCFAEYRFSCIYFSKKNRLHLETCFFPCIISIMTRPIVIPRNTLISNGSRN